MPSAIARVYTDYAFYFKTSRCIPVRTDEEFELIHKLLERVCNDGKPPGKREYLEICNVSNDSQDLGKVAAEAAIRWPGY